MLEAKNFQVFSYQIALFTPSLNFSPNKIHIALAGKYGEILNGDPVLWPIPEDAPKEIPRIILSSKDEKFKLEIANSRINLFRHRIKDENDEIKFSSFLAMGISIFSDYLECTSAKVGRIAVVTRRFLPTENPGLTLAKHFCKESFCSDNSGKSPFNRPENFELHAHKNYPLPHSSIIVNSWVRCKSGTLMDINQPIILVEQDLNTLTENADKVDYKIEQIQSFYEEAFDEQNDILKKYF